MHAYEYEHIVGFEETNLVGNVYYANHLLWQGRCRELFLREHAPAIAEQLQQNLRLVTTRCSCEYLSELYAFDQVVIHMRLSEITQSRLSLEFEYFRRKNEELELVARGEQKIVCMSKDQDQLKAVPVPKLLKDALQAYI